MKKLSSLLFLAAALSAPALAADKADPLKASVVNTAAQTVAKLSPTIAILRRSNISAIAPAGTDTSINGSISAV